jgi:hypothetical protein
MNQLPVLEFLTLDKLGDQRHIGSLDLSLQKAGLKSHKGRVIQEPPVNMVVSNALTPEASLQGFSEQIPKKLAAGQSSSLNGSNNFQTIEKIAHELRNAKNEMEFNKNGMAFQRLVSALHLFQQV